MKEREEKLARIREQIAEQNEALRRLRNLAATIDPQASIAISKDALEEFETALNQRHVAQSLSPNHGVRA